MKDMAKNFLALFLSAIFCIVVLEAILRFYNPFPMRIRGDKIELPVFSRYIYRNNQTDKLDTIIRYSRNSIGFRGEEPPDDLKDKFSIITVGGSTTECLYLSDDKTWPYLLGRKLNEKFKNIWLNNAGMDGHSTYGNIILLRDYLVPLQPKMVIFLVGVNDIGRNDYQFLERRDSIENVLARRFEIAALILNINRMLKAKDKNLGHRIVDLKKEKTLTISDAQMEKMLEMHRQRAIPHYEKKLKMIADICKTNGIVPVFITQPTLLGDTVDKASGVYLGNIRNGRQNGKLYWNVMELYNETTIKVARENHVIVIDLANILPKDSSYFYDFIHFTNKGAEEVAGILFEELKGKIEAINR